MDNIPIYIINLKTSIDRKKTFTKVMDKYNIKFNVFDAINGKSLDEKYIKNNTTFLCNNFLCSNGIIGCQLSHISLWKQLIDDNNNDKYLILEDDFSEIDVNNINILINFINLKKINFDMIRIYCSSLFGCSRVSANKIVITNKLYLKKALFSLSTCGYIISKTGAKKLINYINKIHYHIDFTISVYDKIKNINIYNTNINLITLNEENNSNSTISYKYKTILFYILNKLKLYSLLWYLNVPIFVIVRKYQINIYTILLIILLIINRKNKHEISKLLIYLFIYIELIIIIYHNICEL